MYEVRIQPKVDKALVDFAIRCAVDNGKECADRMTDSFEKTIALLEDFPQRGVQRLKYLPDYYRAVTFWSHKWLVYRIDETGKIVYINYLIDDRSNYGTLL